MRHETRDLSNYRETGLVAWIVLSVVTVAARLSLARAYRKRDHDDDPGVWANRFTVGAFMTAVGWGLASAASLFYSDPLQQMIIMSGESAFVAAAAVRNNGVYKAAMIQTVPLGITVLCCLAIFDIFYVFFGLFTCIYLIVTIEIVRFLNRKTSDLMIAKEQAATTLDELRSANLRLESLTTTDALTGAVNRGVFDLSFDAECRGAMRDGETFSLLIIDIDHFKSLNDTQGHQSDDDCLRRLAACLVDSIGRPRDIVARYGGEEFAIILPRTTEFAAALLAEQVRQAVRISRCLMAPALSGS